MSLSSNGIEAKPPHQGHEEQVLGSYHSKRQHLLDMSSNTPWAMSISPHLEYISTSEFFKLVECSSLTILIYSWIQLPKSKSPSWAQAECAAKMSIWGVFENNVDLSACVNAEIVHLSLQQGLEVDGNIDLYLPQGTEKYVNARTYIKKTKKAVKYAGIYIKKGNSLRENLH